MAWILSYPFIIQSPHSKTISSLSATFCALWRIARFPGSASPTPKSKKLSIRVSFISSSLIVRIALHSPLFRRLALRSGSREGRHHLHRRERFYLADHAGRTFFTPLPLISRSTCLKSRRKARFRGNSHL